MVATIKLISSDEETFEVPLDVARMSITISNLLADLGIDESSEEDNYEPIPIQNVTSINLKKVIDWCEYHIDKPVPEEPEEQSERRTDDIPAWDVRFLNVPQPDLFDIILAANYLDITGLMNYSCKTVAAMMKNKNTQEMRDHFNVESDFTKDEEDQIRRDIEWCAE